MTGKVTLWAATIEACEVPIKTDADPTATPPQFGLADHGSTTPPASYQLGSWVTSYAVETTTARTPTLGGTGATISLTSGTTYDLWVRVVLSGEVAQWPVGVIYCP